MSIATLKVLVNELPCITTIPEFDIIKSSLYDLFANQNGSGQSLIHHYYTTGRAHDEPMIYDPSEQAKWCRQHLQHFSSVAKRIQQIRNKLVHNQVLDMDLFKLAVGSIISLAEKHQNKFAMVLIEQLINVCQHIIGSTGIDQQDQHIDQMLQQSIENTLKLAQQKYDQLADPLLEQLITICQQIKQNELKRIADLMPVLPEIKIQPLSYWKENGWKEAIKGKRIRIRDGKWIDHFATFKSWSGTTVNVVIDDHGKALLRLSCNVEILIE